MAQGKRGDDARRDGTRNDVHGDDAPDDTTSDAVAPGTASGPGHGKKTVRRVVRARPAGRVTLGRGNATRPDAPHQSSQSSQGTRAKKPAPSPASRTGRPTQSKPRFAAVSAASSRLAQRARAATGDAAGATRTRLGRARSGLITSTPQPIGAALAGLLTGLITVLIGWGLTYVFSWLRGTSTGGQTWGKITVGLMLVIAFVIGEQLMRRLRVRRSTLTSLTGICVALAVLLAFLLDLVSGAWAWLVVPVLGAASFAAMHALLSVADDYAKE